jgi:hypothetical protein
MYSFASGIRDKMKMKSRHNGQSRDDRVIPAVLCIIR